MRNNKNYVAGVFFALVNCVSLGFIGLVDKAGMMEKSDPMLFSSQSIFFSLIFAAIFSIIYFKGLPVELIKKVSPSNWLLIIVVGILGSGIFIFLRILGLTESTGTFATLSQIITTSLTAILAWKFLQERLSKFFWVLFAVIIFSTYFVSVGKMALSGISIGDLIIIFSTIFLASSNIFSRIAVKEVDPILLSVGRLFFGFGFLSVLGILLNGSEVFNLVHPLAILSGFFMATAVIGFNFAIKKIGVTLATSILMMAPVITMLLEFSLLNYLFTTVQIISSLVVVLCGIGIILVNKSSKLS